MPRAIESLTDTRIATYTTPELARKLRSTAVETRTPISRIVERALTEYFRRADAGDNE